MTDVALHRWPGQAEDGDHKIKDRNPVLWIVENGSLPPECLDPLEDWVRPPVSREELQIRVACLAERAKLSKVPTMSEDNVLCCQEQRLPLANSEAVIMRELVDNFGHLVQRGRLMELGWGSQALENRNALDLRILRLRRRLQAVQLKLVTVWGKGYMLEVA